MHIAIMTVALLIGIITFILFVANDTSYFLFRLITTKFTEIIMLVIALFNILTLFFPLEYGGEMIVYVSVTIVSTIMLFVDLFYLKEKEKEFVWAMQKELIVEKTISELFDFVKDDTTFSLEGVICKSQRATVQTKDGHRIIYISSEKTSLIPLVDLDDDIDFICTQINLILDRDINDKFKNQIIRYYEKKELKRFNHKIINPRRTKFYYFIEKLKSSKKVHKCFLIVGNIISFAFGVFLLIDMCTGNRIINYIDEFIMKKI